MFSLPTNLNKIGTTHVSMQEFRILTCVIAVVWLSTMAIIWSGWLFTSLAPTKIVSLVATVVFFIYTFVGATTFSSIAGKILMTMSILSLVTLLTTHSFALVSIDTIVLMFALISGLLITKISPHRPLYPWMFLMIATKVELVLVGLLIAMTHDQELTTQMYLQLWWGVIPLMLFGVFTLAMHWHAMYRRSITVTMMYTLGLAILHLFTTAISLTTLVVICSALWPIITERLLGYKVFKTQDQ